MQAHSPSACCFQLPKPLLWYATSFNLKAYTSFWSLARPKRVRPRTIRIGVRQQIVQLHHSHFAPYPNMHSYTSHPATAPAPSSDTSPNFSHTLLGKRTVTATDRDPSSNLLYTVLVSCTPRIVNTFLNQPRLHRNCQYPADKPGNCNRTHRPRVLRVARHVEMGFPSLVLPSQSFTLCIRSCGPSTRL